MSKEIEEWRDIKGYEGLYQVSDWGRVKSLIKSLKSKKKEIILKTYLASFSYHYVKLIKDGKRKQFTVHKLVAETFIPNPDNKLQIDHISGDKNDNSKWNLKWATQKENMNNPVTKEKRLNNPKVSIKIYQYTLDGKLVHIYQSMHEAERDGYGRKEIKKCCLGIIKQHKGYKWSYVPL